jgi:hypothetical protein
MFGFPRKEKVPLKRRLLSGVESKSQKPSAKNIMIMAASLSQRYSN